MLKKSIIVSIVLFSMAVVSLVGCGKSSVNNELIGQIKKVKQNTPLVCPNYTVADVSLGVIQNGVGSMSSQDVWVVVAKADYAKFQQAVETGRLVKVKYDVERFVICTEDHYSTSIEFLN